MCDCLVANIERKSTTTLTNVEPHFSGSGLFFDNFFSDIDKQKLGLFSSFVGAPKSKSVGPSSLVDAAMTIPLMPSRQLELDSAQFNHKL